MEIVRKEKRIYFGNTFTISFLESFDHGDYSMATSNFNGISIKGFPFIGFGWFFYRSYSREKCFKWDNDKEFSIVIIFIQLTLRLRYLSK